MSIDESKDEDVLAEEEIVEDSVEESQESEEKVDQTPLTDPGGAFGSSYNPNENKYSGPVNFIAWANLIVSALFGIYILSEYGSMEVVTGTYYRYTETVLNPIGVGMGVGIIAQGVIVFVLLKIIQTMADDVAALKNVQVKAD